MRGRVRTSTIVWIVGVIILIALLGWATVRILNHPLTTETSVTEPSSSADTSGSTETYSNDIYGFTISYPKELRPGPFSTFHALRNNWRVNTQDEIRGTPVVAIQVVRIDSSTSTKKTYPLFFDAEVRIGVSENTKDCYEQGNGYTLDTVTDVEINGATWKKFIFGDAAMMQYLSGASYRTIRNGRCYALEQIRVGSTYRDDSMTERWSDQELDAFYAKTTPIVMSFKFTE